MEDKNKLLASLMEMAAFDPQLMKRSEEIAGFTALSHNLTIGEKKNFIAIRGIVLDWHNGIEMAMNFILTAYFAAKSNPSQFTEMILSKITFDEKLSVIRKLKLPPFTKNNYKTIGAVNAVRNAFAHGYAINHSKFYYKGVESEHIVFNKKVIEEFENDVVEILRGLIECRKKIKKAPNTLSEALAGGL